MPSKGKPRNPCSHPWQVRWLRLDCVHRKVQFAADEAMAFCKRWFTNSPHHTLLVLVGESGCGKSHIGKAIARYCESAASLAFDARKWDKGGRIPITTYVRWPEQTDHFKTGDYSMQEEMIDTDLLVLDDIGAEHDPSKNAADKLCQVLTRREKKFTVVTTNIKPLEWPTKFDTRIADRLMRNSVVVSMFDVGSYSLL